MFIESIRNLKENSSDLNFIAVILGSDQGRKIFKKINSVSGTI